MKREQRDDTSVDDLARSVKYRNNKTPLICGDSSDLHQIYFYDDYKKGDDANGAKHHFFISRNESSGIICRFHNYHDYHWRCGSCYRSAHLK